MDLKISVVIPYRARLANLRSVFSALAEQTFDKTQFEVVVGVMEYAEEYVRLCQEFLGQLRIVSVLADDAWNVSQARNIAMRQASGQVLMLLDADMILPTHVLDTIWRRHFADGGDVCVLGQALGYSCVVTDLGGEVSMAGVDGIVEQKPFSHYRELLTDLKAANLLWADDRLVLDSVPMPWALVWSGLVALPAAAFRKHELTFDEDFRGWGSEDQEWGYRIVAAGIPVTVGQDVYAMHLPHERDTGAQQESYRRNSRYFLRKWPNLQVEVSRAFGWKDGNLLFPGIERETAAVVHEAGCTLGVVRGTADGADLLLVGAWVDAERGYVDADALGWFDQGAELEILPLAGLALPFADNEVGSCRVLPAIMDLSPQYRDLVLAEAGRVSVAVASPVAGAA